MTSATSGGILSSIPSSIGRIAPASPGLAHASAGHSAGALVEGARVQALIPPGGSSSSIRFDREVVIREVRSHFGTVANALSSPGLLRREWVGPSGIVIESLLAAPTLPLLWMQWHAAGTPEPSPIVLEIDAAALGDGDPVLEQTEHAVLLRSRVPGRSIAAYSVGGGRLTFEPGSHPVLHLTPGPMPEAGITLVLASGSDAELRGALAASAHASAHGVRAAAGTVVDGIVLRTGVDEIDDGLQWARTRLTGMAATLSPDASPRRALNLGVGALGVGDGESARLALRALAPGSAEHALLAGRLAAVLGDSGDASRCAAAFLASDDAARSELRALAAQVLADGLRYAAPESQIAELRACATLREQDESSKRSRPPPRGRSLPMAGSTGRALPMAGGGSTPPLPYALSLQGLLAGDPQPASSKSGDIGSELRTATGLFASDPDRAWALWRSVLSMGLEHGPAGIGTWDSGAEGETPDEALATVDLLLALSQGLLGLAPDAPVGRIRMAPRIPTHLTHFAVSGIPIGGARLRLDYERDGAVCRYTVTPEVAPVPPLLVFEPSVTGEVASTRVDGDPADLQLRSQGSRTVVPVQLPLDGPRVLEVRLREH